MDDEKDILLKESVPSYGKKEYMTADINSLPEGQRAELFDGELVYMASPSRKHQKLVGKLFYSIEQHIRATHGSCEVYPAPFAVYIQDDDRNYVEPDVTVICDSGKLDDRGVHGAPDWILEVVSESSRRTDYDLKLSKYRASGVKEYWIVDIERETVTVHDFIQENIELYGFHDAVKSKLLPGLIIDFSEIKL